LGSPQTSKKPFTGDTGGGTKEGTKLRKKKRKRAPTKETRKRGTIGNLKKKNNGKWC